MPALTRVAVDRFRRDDLEIAPDERLLASFITANHDPTVFDRPEEFDIDRVNAADHVTFGWGPHFCLGAGLARVELQESLRTLLDRFGPPVVVDAGESTAFSVPDELHVTFRVPWLNRSDSGS